MNSLGLVPELFTVAVSQDGAMLGFGQLEPKDSYVELRSMIVDPSARYGFHSQNTLAESSTQVAINGCHKAIAHFV